MVTPVIGCKLPVMKINGQDKMWINAEVLSVRFIDSPNPQYYVHYDLYNKRLDEWVSLDRMETSKIKLPSPKKKPPVKQAPPNNKVKLLKLQDKKSNEKRRKSDSAALQAVSFAELDLESSAIDHGSGLDIDLKHGSGLGDDDPELDTLNTFSKEKELEKLRTSGSMTQSQTEISRLKNINKISMGKSVIDTWYFSPYPEEFTRLDVLFICEFCLEPVGSEEMLARHREKCAIRHPPGNEIYRNGTLSFFELDGRKQRHYCRNLCLISKLFLDHKTLYYEVDPFLYYIMTRTDDTGMHLIGYFSKEKQSSEDYNVACILSLPQYQRQGFGKLLISFSYELSLIEKKAGSPEKPLSDLGLLSYRSFWKETVVDFVMKTPEVSIQKISDLTAISPDDILNTLYAMDMIKFYKGQFIIYVSEKSALYHQRNQERTEREMIGASKIRWTPPKFLPHELNFA